MTTADVVVLLFGGRRMPRPLRGLATVNIDDITAFRRVIVVGSDADLASVLTHLLRADRLDIEVGHARQLAHGSPGQDRNRTPGAADPRRNRHRARRRRGMDRRRGALQGEAVVDDTVLFDGDVAGVRIEPTQAMPGLRAAVTGRGRRRWVAGRAAQLGTPGATVVRDGVAASAGAAIDVLSAHRGLAAG